MCESARLRAYVCVCVCVCVCISIIVGRTEFFTEILLPCVNQKEFFFDSSLRLQDTRNTHMSVKIEICENMCVLSVFVCQCLFGWSAH